MQLEGLQIMYNHYSFEHQGIPAESYGGRAVFHRDGHRLELAIPPAQVQQVMDLLSPHFVDSARGLSRCFNTDTFATAAASRSLEHNAEELTGIEKEAHDASL